MQRSTTTLAVVFAALLVLSIVCQVKNASALSAASITNEPTLSSLNTGRWSRVWTNTNGTGTYFVDAKIGVLKSVLINNTDGSTLRTVTAPLVGGITTSNSLTANTTRTDTFFTQNAGGTAQSLFTGSTTFATEYAATASSLLVGKTVNSITLYLSKTNSPTGTANIACFDSSGNNVVLFGTQNVASLTATLTAYTYTTTTAARTIQSGDRCGIFYNGGDGSNRINVEYFFGADVYDGTTNTIMSTATGAQGSASWSNAGTNELRLSLAYVYSASNVNLTTLNTSELYENQGQIVRAVQSDFDNVRSLRSGSLTAIAEKAAASSTLIGTGIYDTVDLTLKKTGSPTGTATICIFDSSENCLANTTFGTLDVSTLTTAYAVYTFQSNQAISIASGDRIGIKYTGGSVGNTVDVGYTTRNPYDGTNSYESNYSGAGPWNDVTGDDMTFRLYQSVTGSAYQQSGTYIYADFGSNQNTGGMYVYWPDASKIPQTIKISTSVDNVSYTDRVTVNPSQSVGAQFISFDQMYSVRYVKLSVVTWGTAGSMQLAQYERLPTTTATSATAISGIEDNGSVRSVFYLQYSGSTDVAYVGQMNIDTGEIINAVTINSGSFNWFSTDVTIEASKNKVYLDYASSISWVHTSLDRNLTNKSSAITSGSTSGHSSACEVAVDGATASDDVYYCIVSQSGAASIIYKVSGATLTPTNIGTLTGNSGSDVELTNLSGKMVARATAGGTKNTATVNTATDTVSSVLYTVNWNSYTTQQYDFNGSTARTFKTNTEAYYATTTESIHFTPTTGALTAPAELYAETVDSAASTITGISGTLYRISNTLIVSGSATTWTPKLVSYTSTFSPTAYSERLNVPLTLNTTKILRANVVRLVCDASYYFPVAGALYTGNSTDCEKWMILGSSSDPIGRQVFTPFTATSSLVHASPLTAYTFNLAASDPTIFTLKSLYNGQIVDVTGFGADGTAQQLYLFGNCYTIEVFNNDDGQTVNLGQICANDATTKNINLNLISVPPGWPSFGWNYQIARNFGNSTSTVQFDVIYSSSSNSTYTADVLTTDSWLSAQQTFHTWYNFTGVPSNTTSTVMTTIPNNRTIFFIVYDASGTPRLTAASQGKSEILGIVNTAFLPIGNIFGVSPITFFIVIAAAIFVRTNSPFGVIVIAGLTGFLYAVGMIDISNAVWGGLITVAALGGLYAMRRY